MSWSAAGVYLKMNIEACALVQADHSCGGQKLRAAICMSV